MYFILRVAFFLLLSVEVVPAQVQKAYNLNLNTSLDLEDYLQDPSKIYYGEQFPINQNLQFQLEVSARDDKIGTFFGIATVDYGSPRWNGVKVDIVYDCTVEDKLELWNLYLGRSFQRDKKVFKEVGFTSLKWGDLWEVKNSLPDGDELKYGCNIQLTVGP